MGLADGHLEAASLPPPVPGGGGGGGGGGGCAPAWLGCVHTPSSDRGRTSNRRVAGRADDEVERHRAAEVGLVDAERGLAVLVGGRGALRVGGDELGAVPAQEQLVALNPGDLVLEAADASGAAVLVGVEERLYGVDVRQLGPVDDRDGDADLARGVVGDLDRADVRAAVEERRRSRRRACSSPASRPVPR